MNKYTVSLYHQLLKDLAHCGCGRDVNEGYELQVETCFQLAYECIVKLNAKLDHCEFPSEEKEIAFFKTLKPRFTAELEFCKFVYHSVLFIPYESDQRYNFWEREYLRLDTFKEEQKEFLDCYYNQRKDRDAYYFLRRFYKEEHLPVTHAGGSERLARTNGDALSGTLLALERYKIYVEGQFLI
jgi:hypothetical protein